MRNYQSVADAVAEEIRAGRLRAGDRLPPQRDFARLHNIAASTATRVYQELARRGLTVGEVGRGTFVCATAGAPSGAGSAGAADGRVDLELNYPVVPEQNELLAAGLTRLLRPELLGAAMRSAGPVGAPAVREAAADLLARAGWRPDPARVLFSGSGRQAISAAVAALAPPGARLGVEELTYPALKAIAGRLGVTLVPLAMDGSGLVPEAVAEAHRAQPLHAVYVQPALHNPLSLSMPRERLERLAEVLTELGIHAIEDGVWSFLCDGPPLASLAPELTVLVDSLSKRLAPGLSLGLVVAPASVANSVSVSLRSGGWTPMRFAMEAMYHWQADDSVAAIVAAKRRQARQRQELAQGHLGGFVTRGDPRSYYRWWELPHPWRADTFVAAAARYGIAVTPAAAFAVDPRRVPNAVRLGLASPAADTLSRALATLADLARSAPDDLVTD
ncbi:PLP-dependent aminotransferase family protein [Streptomyces roseirectus]|uniref:PLP-dependent aminotransferase family protein n=1 Tax=Streptomyces roseirectus TaxID=2768066 RepID=A0A7H0I7D8_9ACTN|nr:PLP-dependent aminotransferase family protein [Streptomyces roseirectus]QNP68704.1 PLP-dependent aminotransferase family protein [Streptomyces roseirectus]